MKKYIFSLLIVSIFCTGGLQAKHIIGGVMTYECLGNDVYEFTLRVYRDDNCTDCAEFDPVANIGIYRCTNCSNQNQNTPFQEISAPLMSSTTVVNPDYPCLIPPNVVVEEGFYRFQATLPQSEESYHVSYQRCCRNAGITNIFDSENVGATYSINILPDAQELCNSSPVFNEFPPTIICAGAPLEFDHSATDPDGDQLVYSFCPPLNGGGTILGGPLADGCFGAQPVPACPPPYENIQFIAPQYTVQQPMGGNPLITIDENTGLITGTPDIIGPFVVGVCVQEFRNGVLLSTVFRDFQFNVAPCDPTVVADIVADEIINGNEFLVISCGDSTIFFGNESFQETFIDTYEWNFEIIEEEETYNEWEPVVSFPDTGLYFGNLILNPNTPCGDTAIIRVQIYPDLNADFSFDYDTCTAGSTTFTDLSVSESGTIVDWSWAFGDGSTDSIQNPVYTYPLPGEFPAALTVTDINGCEDTHVRNIPYFPVPEAIIVAPSDFVGCQPADIFFNNLSTPISEAYDIFWDFGDGGTGTAISPIYTYEEPGTYTVTIDIVSPLGCQVDTTFNELITILPSPVAGFSFSPSDPSNLEPEVNFFDESQEAIRWFYDFDTGASSTLPNPVYSFPDTGMFQVLQIVTHPSGCQDSIIRVVDVIPEVRYWLPNAFTPNSDSNNDLYRGAGVLDGITNFRLTVFNRWGEEIFSTTDPLEGWNGRKNNTGQPAPNGVYMVLVNFTGPRGERQEYQGSATLIR